MRDRERRTDSEAEQARGKAVAPSPARGGPSLAELVLDRQTLGGNNMVARLVESAAAAPGTDLATRIAAQLHGGRPLPAEIRTDVEAAMGQRLGDVRLHTDGESAQLATELGARAFTTGNDIFFNDGAYDPSTTDGYRVLVHELTHTRQQSDGPVAAEQVSDRLRVSQPTDRDEQAAHATAERIVATRDGGDVAAPPLGSTSTVDARRIVVQRSIEQLDAAARQTLDNVTPEYAQRLLAQFGSGPVTLGDFGPRRCLISLMQEIAVGGRPVSRQELDARGNRYRPLIIVRPDGYWSRALTGEALQRAASGPPRADPSGGLVVGRFQIGRFYYSSGGVIYEVGPDLGQTGPPIGEFGLEHDWFNSALDGAEDAVVQMAKGIAQLITHPIRTIAALANLPTAVGQLIANSPEYWAAFQAMPINDQIRKASEIVSTLLMTYGTAAGTTTRLTAAAADLGDVTINVLRLSANGQLVMAEAVVPVGTTATAMASGPAAIYVLTMANQAAGSAGGGTGGGGGGRPPRPMGPPNYIGEIDELEAGLRNAQGQPVQLTDAHRVALERNAELVSQRAAAGLRPDGTAFNGTVATQLRLRRWDYLHHAPEAREILRRAIEALPDGPIRPGDPTKAELLELLASRGAGP